MRIEYTISEQDFLQAQRLAIKKSKSAWAKAVRFYMPAMGVFMVGFLIVTIVRQGMSLGMVPGALVGFWFLSSPWWIQRQYKKAYARAQKLHGDLVLETSEEGLHFQGATFNSRLSWEHYEKFSEDDKVFLLYENPRICSILPKRHLSPEQIAALRELFSKKIGAKNKALASRA